MKIACCDDELRELKTLRRYITEYDDKIEVSLFTSSKALLSAFETIFFDIVFLDIEMDAPNGFETAQTLKAKKLKPLVVFVTKIDEYMQSGYGIAFRYLTKPVLFDEFHNVMRLCIGHISPQQIYVQTSTGTEFISVRDILYIESYNYMVTIHKADTSIKVRLSLKEIGQQLRQCHFVRCHRSYIVNLKEIRRIEGTTIFLTNNDKISISRSHKQELEHALTELFREGTVWST